MKFFESAQYFGFSHFLIANVSLNFLPLLSNIIYFLRFHKDMYHDSAINKAYSAIFYVH